MGITGNEEKAAKKKHKYKHKVEWNSYHRTLILMRETVSYRINTEKNERRKRINKA